MSVKIVDILKNRPIPDHRTFDGHRFYLEDGFYNKRLADQRARLLRQGNRKSRVIMYGRIWAVFATKMGGR